MPTWLNPRILAITGPESTGKSTLAEAFASKTGALLIPEFARRYLEKKPVPGYTYYDYLAMARGQMLHHILIQSTERAVVVLDTDPVVLKVWGLVKYGQFPEFLENLYQRCRCDVHLLCAPDLPWVPDPLRENPDDRKEVFRRYVELLEAENKPFAIVTGSGEKRFENAWGHVANFGLLDGASRKDS
ncbi:MAG: AAA family ATPase [Flavobacteriales bacterium]|nr:AAA family ATPase [Flavobacteriales bacterium]MDW8431410.1 AAA family ATPase [Flavobacteriales bacterium]